MSAIDNEFWQERIKIGHGIVTGLSRGERIYQAEEKETEKKVVRKRWASESDNNERRRACRTRHPSPENTDGQRWPLCYLPTLLLRGARLSRAALRPGKSTAGRTGRSASSLHCRGEGDKFRGLKAGLPISRQTYATKWFQRDAKSVPVGAAGRGEEVYGWCCADGAPAGRDWRCVCGGEGGPLGELLEPLFLGN